MRPSECRCAHAASRFLRELLAALVAASSPECCAVAVFLGLRSSFEAIALAVIARTLPASHRSLLVSGFLFQIKLIALSAQVFYPVWAYMVEHLFQMTQPLTRHRLAMALCILPCVCGVLWLFLHRTASALSKNHPLSTK